MKFPPGRKVRSGSVVWTVEPFSLPLVVLRQRIVVSHRLWREGQGTLFTFRERESDMKKKLNEFISVLNPPAAHSRVCLCVCARAREFVWLDIP